MLYDQVDLRMAAWFTGNFDALAARSDMGQVTEFVEPGLGPSKSLPLRFSSDRPASLVSRACQPDCIEVWLSYQGSFCEGDLPDLALALDMTPAQLVKVTGSLHWRDVV